MAGSHDDKGDEGSAPPPAAGKGHEPRRRRASTIGERFVHRVEDARDKVVDRLEDARDKVVDQLEHAAEQLHIPVPKTRKSRVLFRSVIVGFLVVAGWVIGLVWWQLRGTAKPDLRPLADEILGELRDREYHKVYSEASPRLQERLLEITFAQEMADLNKTLGDYENVVAVPNLEVLAGSKGRTARVDLQLRFAGSTKDVKGNMSFHYEDKEWRLLGLSVEVPPDIVAKATSHDSKLDRMKGDDVVLAHAVVALVALDRGNSDTVWERADEPFKIAVAKDSFRELEQQRRKELGRFVCITKVLANTTAPGGRSDMLDLEIAYEHAAAIRATFSFVKRGADETWRLGAYKPIMPKPRDPEEPVPSPGAPSCPAHLLTRAP